MNSFCLIFSIIIVIAQLTNAQSPPSISQKSFQFFEQVIDENRKTISTHRVIFLILKCHFLQNYYCINQHI